GRVHADVVAGDRDGVRPVQEANPGAVAGDQVARSGDRAADRDRVGVAEADALAVAELRVACRVGADPVSGDDRRVRPVQFDALAVAGEKVARTGRRAPDGASGRRLLEEKAVAVPES